MSLLIYTAAGLCCAETLLIVRMCLDILRLHQKSAVKAVSSQHAPVGEASGNVPETTGQKDGKEGGKMVGKEKERRRRRRR